MRSITIQHEELISALCNLCFLDNYFFVNSELYRLPCIIILTQSGMLNKCHREVKELHNFFEDWFKAQIPNTDTIVERVFNVLSDDFQLITPEGHLLTREDLMDQLRKSHGSQANRNTYTIEIKNFDGRALTQNGEIFLTTYEEHQYIDDEINIRLSSSLFRSLPEAPNQVEWIHVHEVWL